MLFNSRFLLFFFLILIFFTFNKTYSASFSPEDSIEPYCNGIDVDEFIKDEKIEILEIQVNNNRKWSENLLKALLELNLVKQKSEDWFTFRINKNYKKKFKSRLTVKFKNKNFLCNFKAKIRLTGDLLWHLGWKNGNPISSIYVELLDGHVNSITKFKLFLPKSRYGENEIFTSSILKEVGFLAPRTFMVKSIINGQKLNYIFQEDLRKEFLENLKLREGPILEGDERFTVMIQDKKSVSKINLSRILNKKFLLKNESNARIGLSSVSNLNLIYLQHHQIQNVYQGDKLYINSKKFFKDKLNREQHEVYEALIYALDAAHHLSYDDRRFYFDSINQNYLPIYYDGKSKIINEEQSLNLDDLKNNVSPEAKRGAKSAINLINAIDHNQFNKKLHSHGFFINESDYKKLIKKIKTRLKVISDSDPIMINFLDPKKYFSELITDEAKNKKLVFVNFEKREFYICNLDLTICNTIKNEYHDFKKLLADVISQEFSIIGKEKSSDEDYIFVFDDIDYDKGQFLKKNIWKSELIINDTILKYNNDIIVDVNSESKLIKIKQISNNGRALITKGQLDGWTISFEGSVSQSNSEDSKNYLNLSGCLTFVDIEVQNLTINSNNSKCEDAINLIRVNGNLKSVNIKNSISDALDIDYSKLSINDVYIYLAKNDCIDFSYGLYRVKKIKIEKCGDKGISVGEKSILKINNAEINFPNIGIAVKDSSFMEINESKIFNSPICFAAYRKKQEFYGAKIKINKTNCTKDKFFNSEGSEINLGT